MPFDRRQYQIAYRDKKRKAMLEFLLSHPCRDCGETDPIVLEFDHLPGSEKKRDVAMMVSSGTWSWATVAAEIAKCEVVCANCHKRRTSKRGNHFKEYMTVTIQPVTEPV